MEIQFANWSLIFVKNSAKLKETSRNVPTCSEELFFMLNGMKKRLKISSRSLGDATPASFNDFLKDLRGV